MNKDYQLGNLCSVGSSKRIHLSDYVENGVPFYRSKEIIELSNGNNISETLYISNEKYNEIKEKFPVPKENDILITSVGTIGISYLVKDSNFYFKDGNLTWLRNINSNIVDVKFLIKWLKSDFFLTQIYNNNIGAVQKAITIDYLRQVNISLPDLITQQKIAAVLSALDDKIELNNSINAELEQMAKMLYDYWFVQFDFPNEDDKPYKSSGGKMVYNEVLKREIPDGWKNELINDLGTIIGGSTPSKAIEENFSHNGTPWITPKDLSMNSKNKFITRGEYDVSDKGLKDASLNILPAKSVLMSSRAPIGYLAINRDICTTNQGFKSIVCNKKYSYEYVYYILNQYMPVIEANATGSTFKEISATVFKAINIIKPNKQVVDEFVKRISPIFQKQDNLEQQNQELASLRDWLLPMLMNGQVKVVD
ncbi:restriction endonuclease subunit S [Elizabethkingia anophelis]|nr:restriction endonuclease subunit S [Elizabethkingia anophelis]MCT4193194.1 restriction endonuclease subunit S [Elizabethkingia anophelis]